MRVEFFGREGFINQTEVELPETSRRTFKIGDYVPAGHPSADSVSTKVTSLDGFPVFCERAMYWPRGGPGEWRDGHSTIGIAE